ncbi:hypothetical protein CRENPOLYSF1_20048 [Crenothrix polyspora]|uniref:Uncharacterized protein n=1 Tax=Crenothrix polyspora TaxID=360316 RepID=A0A1R4H5R2_9GAMM|nr:hypothetical protein CRENPOLYSF1_20048 [Crenothrix polyspora]
MLVSKVILQPKNSLTNDELKRYDNLEYHPIECFRSRFPTTLKIAVSL